MAILKSFRKFKQDLPRPPEDIGEALVAINHPQREPSLEYHYNLISSFEEWLTYPNSYANNYPSDANDTSLDIGG